MSDEPDAEVIGRLLSSLPRTKITPQTITQPVIDNWYRREGRYREQISSLRDHIDADHTVMVQLGRIAETAVRMLEHVNMDTGEDRELHARAVGALRARLGEIAATMKEAGEVSHDVPPLDCSGVPHRDPREGEAP